MAGTVVFTSIFGNYDDLNDPIVISDSIKYVCFTDNPDMQSETWDVRIMPSHIPDDPHRSSRLIKLCGHRFLSEFDYSFYIDGNMILKVVPDVPNLLNGKSIAAEKHPARDCVYDEVAACDYFGKEDLAVMTDQVNDYRFFGFPAHAGLFQCGVLARNWSDPMVCRLCELWWQHILHYSKRDQLSFPFVFRDFAVNGFSSVVRNNLIAMGDHNSV